MAMIQRPTEFSERWRSLHAYEARLLKAVLRSPAKKTLVHLLFLMLLATAVHGQATPDPLHRRPNTPQAWLSLGVGYGAMARHGSSWSTGASASFALPRRPLLGQFALNGSWPTSNEPEQAPYAATAGLALGRAWASYDVALATFVGPALAWGRKTTGAPTYQEPGLVVGWQFFVTPAPTWGLGFDVVTSLSRSQRQMGARLALQIGSARR